MIGSSLRWLASCNSTNEEAMGWAAKGAPDGALVWARSQRSGRGRRGRVWNSNVGDLFVSFILRPTLTPSEAPPLTLAAGLAALRTLRSLGVDAMVKWPNDIYVGKRKIAGVLTEMSSRGGILHHVVVGIGINVSSKTFPSELHATSLALETPGNHKILDVLDTLSTHLGECTDYVAKHRHLGALTQSINEHLFKYPVRFEINGKHTSGISQSVDRYGQLEILDDAGNVSTINAGECEVVV